MMNVAPLLIVDDNPEFRDLVCEALSHEGYCTLGAASGAVALKVLETVEPALILVDVNMPSMSGPEFVREAQERGSLDPYRVVMISGSSLECSSMARWRLTKPLDLGLLLRVVEDFCGTGQLATFWSRPPAPGTPTALSSEHEQLSPMGLARTHQPRARVDKR